NQYEKCLISILYYTGIRNQELRNLRRYDVDLENRTLNIRIAKGGKTRKLGLCPYVYRELLEYLSTFNFSDNSLLFPTRTGNIMTQAALVVKVRNIGNRAGVSVYPHKLRASCITHNIIKGVPLPVMQEVAGHASIVMTRQ